MEFSLSLSQTYAAVGFRRSYSTDLASPKGKQHICWQCYPVTLARRSAQQGAHQTFFVPCKVLSYQKKITPLVEGRSMEEIYDALTERLRRTSATVHDDHSKYIVGLAGPPGAGKSTVAAEVVQRLNKHWSSEKSNALPKCIAVVLPMDGFHLYRSQLDAMEDPEEAHARRGAPWTFNPELLLKCLQTLWNQGSVYAPSFDHGVGDPIEDDIFISPEHRIVVVEGNYLFLQEGAWKEISKTFDEKWFLDVDIDAAMRRVVNRHISTGRRPDVAEWRVAYNDRPNAELILTTKKNADLVIRSVDFRS